jgi:hypothetical protein
VLLRWYSLMEHGETPRFAFDKIDGHFDSPILRWTTLIFAGLSVIYMLGYWLISRASSISKPEAAGIGLLVTGPALVNVLLYPVGALDVFNYLIRLRLIFHYGDNPYTETIVQYPDDPFRPFGFMVDVPLFYGPVWALISGPVAMLGGFGDSVVPALVSLKVFNALLLLAIAVIINHYHQESKRKWLAVYMLLANPLILFEGIGNAHNDVLMTLFLVAAIVTLKHDSVLAMPLLALSALVKFFTGALAPLLFVMMIVRRWGWRRSGTSLALSAVVVAATAAPFWDGGGMIHGLRDGLERSQDMHSASIFSLTREYLTVRDAPEAVIDRVRWGFMALFGISALLVAWTALRGREIERTVIDTMLLFSLLLSLLYPWYLIPVIAVIAMRWDRLSLGFLFAITALGLLYYPLSVWAWFHSGWTAMRIHVFQAIFTTLPILVFLGAEAARALGSRSRSHEQATARGRQASVQPRQAFGDRRLHGHE